MFQECWHAYFHRSSAIESSPFLHPQDATLAGWWNFVHVFSVISRLVNIHDLRPLLLPVSDSGETVSKSR
jgi:hypothetical protein